jgi:hypothetical protein
MAKIDVADLVSKMVKAALGALQKRTPEIRDYAETAFQHIGEAIRFIEAQRLAGRMTEDQARLHLEMQKNTARTILLAIEGLGLLAVEAAINAALAVMKDAVNTALKFPLL